MMDWGLLIQEKYFSESPSKVKSSFAQSGTAEESFNSYSVRGRAIGSGTFAAGLSCSKSVSRMFTLFPKTVQYLHHFLHFNVNIFKRLFYWNSKSLCLLWVEVGK